MGPVKVIPVVIDTNIVISGLLFDGKIGKIVNTSIYKIWV